MIRMKKGEKSERLLKLLISSSLLEISIFVLFAFCLVAKLLYFYL